MLGFASYAQMNAAKRVNGFSSPIPGKLNAAPMAKMQGAKDMPNWQPIGSGTWSSTDINGNTVNLSDTLAAGKALVIDYSATWCSWCWVVHQAGLLEGIYNQLGSDVCVVWVEADNTTSTSSIYGGSGSQGDWTNNGTVPYPIIDDASLTGLVNDNVSAFPTIVFVSPEGYFCDLYSKTWGFGPYDTPSQAVSAVSYLYANSPAAGQAPLVDISGPSATSKGVAASFEATIVSVDNVTGISWTITGADITTSTDNPVTVTWANGGTYTISVSVTNTTGTTTVSKDITVNDWSDWGDTMSYCGNEEFYTALGTGGDITWGIVIPATYLANRDYVTGVEFFSNATGDYQLSVYKGGDNAPQTLLYEHTYNVTTSNAWVSLPIYGDIAIDDTKPLWVVLTSSGYSASGCDFTGDYNSSLVYLSGNWYMIQDVSDYDLTWMIKVISGSTVPLNVAIDGPANCDANQAVSFSAAGPSGATYSWTFQGANNTSATGANVTATWSNPGTYTVTLNASHNGATATATHTISVFIPASIIFDFENASEYSNWTYIDADGDGYGWSISDYGYNDSKRIMSESYSNTVGVLTPDNWFFTKPIKLTSNNAMSWWVKAQDANYADEYYSVYVCSAPTVASATAAGSIYDGYSTGDWVKKSADLSEYSGQTIYIAFRHYNSSDMFQIGIDELSILGDANVGINSIDESNVVLYPNPTNSMINIIAEGLKTVEVMDMTGRMVMTSESNTIDMSQLANGVYVVRVSTLNGTSIQKVVKK